jgi:glycosyltransferase involved in cell wall biosynthesis
MRIVIDMQGAQNGSRFRGIGRYTTAFSKHLIQEATNGHEVILALNGAFGDTIDPIRREFAPLLPQTQIVVWEPLGSVHYHDQKNDGRRMASEAIREAFLSGLEPDVVIVSSIFEGSGDNVVSSIGAFLKDLPTAVILYDFIPLIFPKEYLAHERLNSWYMEKLHHMKQANLVLSISESSRNEGLEHLGFPQDAVVNISTAIDSDFSNAAGTPRALLASKFGLTRPYLMYSGASDPRKNLPRLLEAFAALDITTRRKHQLLLAGGMPQEHLDALMAHVMKLKLGADEVLFAGRVTDDEMVGLYRGALGFVFASYHEGFGLPVLEAMAFDVPVIGSNISSIPEVIGNQMALFDPFSVPSLSAAMHKLLTDAPFRQSLVSYAMKQRNLFSWQITAQKTLRTLVEKFGTKHPTKTSYTCLQPLVQQHLLTEHVSSVMSKYEATTEEMLRAAVLIDYVLPRSDKPRRLFVDVSELQRTNNKTSIQQAVNRIFANLVKQAPEAYQVVPVYATRAEEYKVANRFMCEFWGFDTPSLTDHALDFRNGDIFLGLDYLDLVICDRREYFAKLQRTGVAVYFVVYDLLPQQLEGAFSYQMTLNHSAWLSTVAMSDGLICVSKAVANELHNWLTLFGPSRKDTLPISWFHLGVDIASPAIRDTVAKDRETVLTSISMQQSFLVVGGIEPNMRQSQILTCFELLWRQGENVCLVLIEKRGRLADEFVKILETHPEKNKRLFWLEGVNDSYLNDVFIASSCLIAAASGCGFDLSLIKAAQHKTPILARDTPLFREIAGEHATYFKGAEGSELAAAVQAWRKDERSGKLSKTMGMPWLTWQQSAAQLLDVIFLPNWPSNWSFHDARASGSPPSDLASGRQLRPEPRIT